MYGGGHGEVAERLFSLPTGHGYRLFTADASSPADATILPEEATAAQVARRIRTYVEWAKERRL
jgi:hypothetical protein